MIDLNLEEAHLGEVSPKEPLHGGLLSGLRTEIQDTEAPQWRPDAATVEAWAGLCGGFEIKLRRKSMEIAVVQDTRKQRFAMITLGF